jgi:hypothetical protein
LSQNDLTVIGLIERGGIGSNKQSDANGKTESSDADRSHDRSPLRIEVYVCPKITMNPSALSAPMP